MYYQKREHAFNIASKAISNGKVEPVILIDGEEDFLINWFVNALKKKYIAPGFEQADFVIIDGKSREESDIFSACTSYSMLSEKKVVWIKDSKLLTDADFSKKHKEDVDLILDNVQSKNDSCIIVLSATKIDKRIRWIKDIKESAPIYTFGKLERGDLASFVQKRLNRATIDIDNSMLNELIEMTGYYTKESNYNLYQLENDVKKLIAYLGPADNKNIKKVSIKDIEETILGYENKYIFNLINAIYSQNTTKSIELLHNMRDTKVTNIVSGLIANIEFILKLKELVSENKSRIEIKNLLKVADGRIDANMKYLTILEFSVIRSMLINLYDIDYKMKSGKMGAMLGLEMLICG